MFKELTRELTTRELNKQGKLLKLGLDKESTYGEIIAKTVIKYKNGIESTTIINEPNGIIVNSSLITGDFPNGNYSIETNNTYYKPFDINIKYIDRELSDKLCVCVLCFGNIHIIPYYWPERFICSELKRCLEEYKVF